MPIELLDFAKPTVRQYAELLNSAAVQKHLPLSEPRYSDEWIAAWIEAKSRTWSESRKGPWSAWLDGEFAGWVGVEPSGSDLSFGIVLLQRFWGRGWQVTEKALDRVCQEFPNAKAIQIELPLSRKSEAFAERLGLRFSGELVIGDHKFVTYNKSLSKTT